MLLSTLHPLSSNPSAKPHRHRDLGTGSSGGVTVPSHPYLVKPVQLQEPPVFQAEGGVRGDAVPLHLTWVWRWGPGMLRAHHGGVSQRKSAVLGMRSVTCKGNAGLVFIFPFQHHGLHFKGSPGKELLLTEPCCRGVAPAQPSGCIWNQKQGFTRCTPNPLSYLSEVRHQGFAH